MHRNLAATRTLALGALLALLLNPVAPASASTVDARTLLGRLTVAAERGAASYDREEFADWYDADGDGCDTRQEVLIAESRTRTEPAGSCPVSRGTWFSYYDGLTWSDPGDVDVDHVVALAEAWRSGARRWREGERRRFANDLRFGASLQAVTDNVNSSKGDRDPAEWLPSRARCKYAIRWVQVKYRWRLRINHAERAALGRILDGDCGRRDVRVPRRAR